MPDPTVSIIIPAAFFSKLEAKGVLSLKSKLLSS